MREDEIKSRKNKKETIVSLLRHQITSGKFSPGDEVPTRDELLRQFKTSKSTVQAALAQLASEGFVSAHGAAGTRVVSNPPHLNWYALLIPNSSASEKPSSLFWETLQFAASAVCEETDNKILSLHIGSPGFPTNDYEKTVSLINSYRLAGLIPVGPPYLPTDSPLVHQSEIPVAAIEPPDDLFPGVYPDFEAFFRYAADYLYKKGRKRISILHPSGIPTQSGQKQNILNGLKSQNIHIDSYCIQECSPECSQSARGIMHLMMSLPADKRPNGLIIADDNLVVPATAGLIDARVEIPHELEVVAHCNYPLLTPDVLPYKRLGFDCKEILEQCINLIQLQKNAEKECRRINILPKFKKDVPEKRMMPLDNSRRSRASMS